MERKIGEIFEYNGEWYQCVESDCCGECSLFTTECGSGTKSDLADKVFGQCSKVRRTDSKHVIFKKLEKVGEPYSCNYYGDNRLIMMQEYNLFNLDDVTNEDKIPMYITDYKHKRIAIEIKETKEDMEEKKLNLKPFDIQKAREGKPVRTRDGRKARIICFDVKGSMYPIIALIEESEGEKLGSYMPNGRSYKNEKECIDDLMMLPEKKEGWVNVYRDCDGANITKDDNIYSSKEAAIASAQIIDGNSYIATTKINWEE